MRNTGKQLNLEDNRKEQDDGCKSKKKNDYIVFKEKKCDTTKKVGLKKYFHWDIYANIIVLTVQQGQGN